MPTTLGSVTTSKFENSPEAHKLHIEFEVAAGQVVHEGDAVILAAAGTIQLAGTGASAETLIGVAIMDGIAGERVTVSMKGYTRVNAEAGTASLNAGPVELGAYNTVTDLREYAAASTAPKTVGHNLTQATADGDPIQVVILL